jgi:hypothetical protein
MNIYTKVLKFKEIVLILLKMIVKLLYLQI